ncbi:MAG: hypothetical protein U0074_10820 [Kouleothrix sp.]
MTRLDTYERAVEVAQALVAGGVNVLDYPHLALAQSKLSLPCGRPLAMPRA